MVSRHRADPGEQPPVLRTQRARPTAAATDGAGRRSLLDSAAIFPGDPDYWHTPQGACFKTSDAHTVRDSFGCGTSPLRPRCYAEDNQVGLCR